jgi:hypothetical protein
MSGIKDVMVTMTRTERDRMVNNARSAAETAEQMRQRQQASQNALNVANMKLETLNVTLNNEITGLHSEMRQMANDQNRRLREQAASFNGAISDIKTQMERNRQSLQNAINNVQANIEAKEKNHQRLAEFWISQTEAFFTDIEQYRHDLFTPNQLQRLKDQLGQISADMRTEAFQAAISSSRNVFNQAADLKERVVNAEIEWSYYHTRFQQALADAKSNLNYRRSMQFTFTTENGDETVDAKINYWTDGTLDSIAASLAKIEQSALQADGVSTQELIAMTETLGQINGQIELAEGKAKEAFISSQMRAQMASRLAEALADLDWDCDGVTYEGEEHSEPVHIKLSDGNGNEIVAIITPDKKSPNMANNLELNFFDPKNNDEGLRRTWIGSIRNRLAESGLNVGEPVCREGYETKPSDNSTVRDIQTTARKPAARRKAETSN